MTDERQKELIDIAAKGQEVANLLHKLLALGDTDSRSFGNILDGAMLAIFAFAGEHAVEGKRVEMMAAVKDQFEQNLAFTLSRIADGDLPA